VTTFPDRPLVGEQPPVVEAIVSRVPDGGRGLGTGGNVAGVGTTCYGRLPASPRGIDSPKSPELRSGSDEPTGSRVRTKSDPRRERSPTPSGWSWFEPFPRSETSRTPRKGGYTHFGSGSRSQVVPCRSRTEAVQPAASSRPSLELVAQREREGWRVPAAGEGRRR
jgi:hypothetical protein